MSKRLVVIGLMALVLLALAAMLMTAPSLLAGMPRHARP
jgi:hypothetical protein